MPHFSQRALDLPASPIRKLAPFADAAKAAGTRVYHLNIGQPDIETPKEFFQAFNAAKLKILEYSPSAGMPVLLEQIGKYYQRLGHALDREDILVTTGASEAISFIVAAVCDAGDEIIVPEPFYANYQAFSIAGGARVVTVPSTIENDFALPTIQEFESRITDRTRAILICNPGNPTGVLYPPAALEELVKLAVKHDLHLIADEVYREFVYETDFPHQSVLGFDDARQHVIVIDSISKRFSACGARIGCIISRNRQVTGVVLKMAQARLSPPTFGQIGAAAVYQLPDSFYKSVVDEYKSRRDLVQQRLAKMKGVVCPPINGAFYAMVRLPIKNSEAFCQWLLEEFSHEGATLMMAPGAGFYATPGRGLDEVRIAYVLNCDDLSKAMDCLEAGLKAYSESECAAV